MTGEGTECTMDIWACRYRHTIGGSYGEHVLTEPGIAVIIIITAGAVRGDREDRADLAAPADAAVRVALVVAADGLRAVPVADSAVLAEVPAAAVVPAAGLEDLAAVVVVQAVVLADLAEADAPVVSAADLAEAVVPAALVVDVKEIECCNLLYAPQGITQFFG